MQDDSKGNPNPKATEEASKLSLFPEYPDQKLEKLLEGEDEAQADMARGVYYANYPSHISTSHLDATEIERVMRIVDKARAMW